MERFSIEFDKWEDGGKQRVVLHRPDRWEVHSAQECIIFIDDIDPIRVVQKPNQLSYEKIGVGACVWDGALLLAGYLASGIPRHRFIGTTCIELGAGVGLISVLLAKMGAYVYSTDLQKVLPLLEENAKVNGVANASSKDGCMECIELEWGADGWMDRVAMLRVTRKEPDYVLAADCCYFDGEGPSPSTKAFVETCHGLSGPKTKTLVSFERRSSEVRNELLKFVGEYFGCIERIDVNSKAVNLPMGLRLDYCDLYEFSKPL